MVFRWQCDKQQKGSLEFGMSTARSFNECKWLKWKVLTWWELLFFSFFNYIAFNSGSTAFMLLYILRQWFLDTTWSKESNKKWKNVYTCYLLILKCLRENSCHPLIRSTLKSARPAWHVLGCFLNWQNDSWSWSYFRGISNEICWLDRITEKYINRYINIIL